MGSQLRSGGGARGFGDRSGIIGRRIAFAAWLTPRCAPLRVFSTAAVHSNVHNGGVVLLRRTV
jgi:hypothetical protein